MLRNWIVLISDLISAGFLHTGLVILKLRVGSAGLAGSLRKRQEVTLKQTTGLGQLRKVITINYL